MNFRAWQTLLLFTLILGWEFGSGAEGLPGANGTPVISEFMANNDGALLDGLGEASDWIELHNPTAESVNLAGWTLADSANQWTFPEVHLPAGGYLVVFASGKLTQPYSDPLGYLHTNFKLDAAGEELTLRRPDGAVASAYPAPGAQRRGVSFGLLEITTALSTYENPARLLVPGGGIPDAWRVNAAFDDASWLSGQASAGYGTASGGTVAYRVHTATPGNQPIGESLGMDFVVNREVIITELGCFDDNGDGLTRTITVQLWRRNDHGTPENFGDDTGVGAVASLVFTPGASGVLLEGSRFKPLSAPVTLAPGAYSILAWGYGDGERAGNLGVSIPPEPWETQSGGGALSFVGTARPGLAGTFPTNPDGGPANRYAAGTFKFVEPNDPLLHTPLRSAMQNINATAFMRVLFTLPAAAAYESLLLKFVYDDGCVVWLNGVEIARRNAPAILTSTSSATAQSYRTESLPLSASLLVPGLNLLAVQGLNISASDDDFLMSVALDAVDIQAGSAHERYFPSPTPGAPNSSTGVLGYVADTKFSVGRGFYETPFDLVITNATPGALIRYTRDGSVPTETHGWDYTAPIRISSTSVIAATAFKPGFEPANVDIHTYLFAQDVAVQSSTAPPGYPTSWTDFSNGGTYVADYGMVNPVTQPVDYARAAGSASFTIAQARAALAQSIQALPVISIVTDKAELFDPDKGIYLHPNARGEAWERPVSVELITTNGVEDWHARAGLHIMGLTSRRLDVTPKLNFMLVFSAQYGDPWLLQPFFGRDGPTRIKRIALRSNTRDGWLYESSGFGTATYLADGFAKDALLASGEPGTRHRFCHVFLNGLYWGVYNPTERPESHWAETTFGGEDEDYDVINLCCPNRIDNGDFTEWQMLLAAARNGFATAAAYQAVQGNDADGRRNPARKRLLGVDSFIGFALNGYYHASLDWPDNFFALYDNVADRTEGWRFVTWDTDLGFPNLDVTVNKVTPAEGIPTWASHDAPFAVDVALRQNPEYRMRLADRVYREFFHEGAYTTSANRARWERLRDQLQPGLYAESARWGDYRSGGLRTVQEHWLPRVSGALANAWFNGRNAQVLSHLRQAGLYPAISPPEFNQQGGQVPASFQFILLNPNSSGTIYFTLDGTDPRLPGGALSSAAQVYRDPVLIIGPTRVLARVRDGTIWSALNQAQFYPPQDLAALQLSEIMYNPPASGGIDGEEFEFLELKNIGNVALDLTGLTFTRGISFTFTNGTMLGPDQEFVLARNPVQFALRYPGASWHGLYSGKLDNSGETLQLSTALGATLFTVSFNNRAPWPAEADNFGLSLQRLSFLLPATNAAAWIAAPPTPGGPLPVGLRDQDGDGMADAWETAHQLIAPDDDADHDGLTNYEEFRAGTDPQDQDDLLRLDILEPGLRLTSTGRAVVLGFSARSNHTYSILYRERTLEPGWTNLMNFPVLATNRFVVLTNALPAEAPTRFYRLVTPRFPNGL